MPLEETRQHIAISIQLVDLVKHHQRWLAIRSDFFQHGIHRSNLFVRLRMADIHDVQQQIGLDDFFQRGFESLDQAGTGCVTE